MGTETSFFRRFVLRNYIAENAIKAAEKEDYSVVSLEYLLVYNLCKNDSTKTTMHAKIEMHVDVHVNVFRY